MKRFFILLLATIAFSAFGQQPQYQFKQEIPRPTTPVSFDLPITCTAQKTAVGGYRFDGFPDIKKELYEDVHVAVDDEPTTWKITVRQDGKADVVASGWSGTTTETWLVAAKTDEDLILVYTDHIQNIRTITINAKYRTFVHCFNGELFFVNYGVVFWGTCSN
jgi:hypothetical protein